MGPLVPELIGNELNLVVAFFIGIAFGAILEQAGFSTSKKLVGLFYGYDFTVLRVFFTAGVTAMLGVVAFGHFGLLDVSLIYINPTFLWSAIVGGLIMGLGFVIGGFCPGTSICAAAIGKIDAMYFVFGSAIGVLIFAEGYPIFEGLYKAENWGGVRVFNSLGMSQSLFAFLLTFVAVFAFWATTIVETKINGKPNPEFKSKPLYISLSIIAVIIGISTFFMPDRKDEMMNRIESASFINSYKLQSIDCDELAYRLMYNDKSMNIKIFDLRPKKEQDKLALPNSNIITLQNLFELATSKTLLIKDQMNIFIADDEFSAKKACVLASELGFSNVYYLKGGLNEFASTIINFKKPNELINKSLVDTYRFRETASQEIPVLIKEYMKKKAGSEGGSKKAKRVVGGC